MPCRFMHLALALEDAARKTAVAVGERVVGEVVLINGVGVRGGIDAITAAGRADVRAVDGGAEGHHVLVDHAAEDCVAAWEVG